MGKELVPADGADGGTQIGADLFPFVSCAMNHGARIDLSKRI
jgi:hypothetical protein